MSADSGILSGLLKDLIAIPSVNPTFGGGGEREIANYVENFLAEAGLRPERQPVFEGGRDNIIAAIGGGSEPAILIEAHLDTVGVEGWFNGRPFEPVEEEGRIFGRGACDTKASLAVFLSVAAYFAKNRDRLAVPLVFAATIDEEDLQTGAFRLMERGLKLRGAITGEPTRLEIIHAHKGVLRFRVRTEGIAAHSAFPERGKNAILRMGAVLSVLEKHAEELGRRPADRELGSGTLNVGVIRGGDAVNVVPDRCFVDIDRRLLPGESADEVWEEIRDLLAGIEGVVVEEPVLSRLGIATPTELEFVRDLAESVREERGESRFGVAPYMTNATAYAAAGIPAVVFGPGDIANAHTRDESVGIWELEEAFRVLVRFLETG